LMSGFPHGNLRLKTLTQIMIGRGECKRGIEPKGGTNVSLKGKKNGGGEAIEAKRGGFTRRGNDVGVEQFPTPKKKNPGGCKKFVRF